jgi:hypothetical protein
VLAEVLAGAFSAGFMTRGAGGEKPQQNHAVYLTEACA